MTRESTTARRSAVRRGQYWQREAAKAIADSGLFPHAGHVGMFPPPGIGDITGVGDRIIEVTVAPWGAIRSKLAEALYTAGAHVPEPLDEWFVMKRLNFQTLREELLDWWLLTTGEKLPASKPVPEQVRKAYREAFPPGLAEWVCVWRADVCLALLTRLDALEEELLNERDRAGAAEERADDAYGRGFDAGRRTVEIRMKGGLL